MKNRFKNLNTETIIWWAAVIFIVASIWALASCQKAVEVKSFSREMSQDEYLVPETNNAKPTTNPGKGNKGKPEVPPTDTVPTTAPLGTARMIYVNFEGEFVDDPNWYNQEATQQPFYAPPAALTTDEKQTALNDPIKAYAAYNVIVTTDRYLYNNHLGPKIQVVVTPYTFITGGSGFAYLGSMFYGTEETAFVFTERLFNMAEYIGKIITHEAGHTINLRHQSTYNPDCTLYGRYREGAKMGFHWSTEGEWVYGTTYACNIFQDDKKILAESLGLK